MRYLTFAWEYILLIEAVYGLLQTLRTLANSESVALPTELEVHIRIKRYFKLYKWLPELLEHERSEYDLRSKATVTSCNIRHRRN